MKDLSEASATRARSVLRELRQARGWTVEDLASRAGISSRTIYDLEGGYRQPQPATRRVLALALRCNPGELFTPETSEARGPHPEPRKVAGTSGDHVLGA
jgi:transcriptional regulator with XRE-family HTH domain